MAAKHLYGRKLSFILIKTLLNSTKGSSDEQKKNKELAFKLLQLINIFSEEDKNTIKITLKETNIKNLIFLDNITHFLN